MKEPPRIGPLQIEAWQQYSEWFTGNWNWQNFTLIEISYEHDGGCGNYELQLSLAGLCLRLTWFKKEPGPQLKLAMERRDELMAEHNAHQTTEVQK